MIDLDGLPARIRIAVKLVYAVYASGAGVFALVMVVFDFFDLCAVQTSFEVLALLGIAIVAPIFPFVPRLTFPGGGGLNWNKTALFEDLARKVDEAGPLILQRVDTTDFGSLALGPREGER